MAKLIKLLRSVFCAGAISLAVLCAPAMADERDGTPMPLQQIMAIVTERYQGEIVAAEVRSGKKREGTDIVYELRLLTPRSNMLKIRIDAMSGDFLEVDGRGLVDARRLPGEHTR